MDDDLPAAPDQIFVLLAIVAKLGAIGVPYMLTGSTALNYYGVPRLTRDINLVIDLDVADGGRLTEALSADFYVDRDAVLRAATDRRIVNVIHFERLVKVDLIVRKETDFARTEFSRRSHVDAAGGLWLVSPEDLVLAKLAWARKTGSDVQLRDVRDLVRAVTHLDRAYIDTWVRLLDLLSEARLGGVI